MANQGSQGGSSEQHRKAGEQSHKNDDRNKASGGSRESGGSQGSGSHGDKRGTSSDRDSDRKR